MVGHGVLDKSALVLDNGTHRDRLIHRHNLHLNNNTIQIAMPARRSTWSARQPRIRFFLLDFQHAISRFVTNLKTGLQWLVTKKNLSKRLSNIRQVRVHFYVCLTCPSGSPLIASTVGSWEQSLNGRVIFITIIQNANTMRTPSKRLGLYLPCQCCRKHARQTPLLFWTSRVSDTSRCL